MHPYAVIDLYSTITTTLDTLLLVWPDDGEEKTPALWTLMNHCRIQVDGQHLKQITVRNTGNV